jgi:FtsP/CotA-like multicopper oxidase with cupredoxin domain/DNA-binding beta-propeller fold protein YncE/plastocyanin
LVNRVYDDKPSIPGPTIMMTEGDEANITLINSACEDAFVDGPEHPLPLGLPTYSETSLLGIHVHGVHYDISDDATYSRMNMDPELSAATCGGSVEYHWVASPGTSGTWPYHDHTFSINEIGGEELGLFGTLIVNPANGKVNGLVDEEGNVKTVNLNEIDKEFVLWMVSTETLGRSIFYGNEIDYDVMNYAGQYGMWRETALWTNPSLFAEEGKNYRFHVLGLGEETHAFHMHGHRWTENINDKPSSLEDIIDVKEITPLQRHTFLITASANDDAEQKDDSSEGWMYHCHFVDHMQQGMSGMMTVLPNTGDADLPIVGAAFTLSDEPGLWMKTLNAGVADDLDEYLEPLTEITPKKGTGYPLGYISEAVGDLLPGGETDFTYSEGRSLAVINKGETVIFGMKDSQTKHTITTFVYPTDAPKLGGNGLLGENRPAPFLGHYDQQLGIRGSAILTDMTGKPVGLEEEGLYAFVCKIHPYMFGAVIVDDPETNLYVGEYTGTETDIPFPLLDLGSDGLTALVRGTGDVDASKLQFPQEFDPLDPILGTPLTGALVSTVYVITDSNNWKDYTADQWNVSLPPVLVTTNNENVTLALAYDTPTLEYAIDDLYATGVGLVTSSNTQPTTQVGLALGGTDLDDLDTGVSGNFEGVGEVWVNTQFERTVNKNHEGTPFDKPGTITVVNATDGTLMKKISLPEINMNHPHNMWADTSNEVIYQTEWFGSEMAVIDRDGELIKEIFVGQSPSHVMTNPQSGEIYVAINGEESVNEFDPVTYELERQLSTGFRSHPHGHWVSSSGQYIVTPDFLGLKASIHDLDYNDAYSSDTILYGPIATGMKGDESVFYTADFLGNSMTAIDPSDGEILGHINFITHGLSLDPPRLLGLPIQTPISPDDKWMVTALTLGSSIAVIDVESGDPGAIVEILPCDPGCHGVQWGAKQTGDGYYAYVSSKFSNALIVVDPEGPSDGTPEIVGRILLADRTVETDDPVIGYDGMGGQGVLSIPNVYGGWIEATVLEGSSDYIGELSTKQKAPLTSYP